MGKVMETRLIGLKEDIPQGLIILNETLKSLTTTDDVEFATEIPTNQMKDLEEIADKFGINLQISVNKKGVHLTGPESGIRHAMKAITSLIIESSKKVAVPTNWLPQTENLAMIDIIRGCEEWNKVQDQIEKTLPNCSIFTQLAWGMRRRGGGGGRELSSKKMNFAKFQPAREKFPLI